jgi:translation initiation factor IF-2
MPQTLEALSHAKAAKVPIIVAVNKIDHPNANPLKVRQQLQDKGLVPDDWGGDTIYVDVSALTKQGVDKLIEMILLQADLLELKANPNRRAKGNVIESGLEPGGPTATVLVRKGTLRVGDVILCGQFYGRVRALINEEVKRLKEAGPSVAVKVLGLNGVPEAGLEFSVVEDEKAARDLAEQRTMEAKAEGFEAARGKVTSKPLSKRSRKLSPTKYHWKSSIAPSAPSPNPTWRWPRLPPPSFSVSTPASTAAWPTRPSTKACKSNFTPLFTN